MRQDQAGLQRVADSLMAVMNSDITRSAVSHVVSTVRRNIRFSRRGVTISGYGIADALLALAPKIPVRKKEEFVKRYGTQDANQLATYAIVSASRVSAGIGGATGAMANASLLSPPTWLALPVEIVAETVLIAMVEIRLIAELHEIYGVALDHDEETRAQQLLATWSSRKGVDIASLGAITPVLSARGIKATLMRSIRRRILARSAKNVSSAVPFLIGAGLGAAINRKSTRTLGLAIKRELAVQSAAN